MDSGSGLPMPSAQDHEESDSGMNSLADGVDSAARVQSAEDRVPAAQSKYPFARISVVIIMLVWVVTGFSKVSHMSEFVDIVEQHQVIPENMKAIFCGGSGQANW